MPVLGQIEEARNEGYSEDEIMSYLSQLPDYSANIKTAIDEGYSASEILGYYESSEYLSSIEKPAEEPTEKKPSFAQRALGVLKDTFTFSPEQEAKFKDLVGGAGLKPLDKEFQEAVAKTPETDNIIDKGIKTLAKKGIVEPFRSFNAGVQEETAQTFQTLDNYAKAIEKETGIKRGGIFGDLAEVYRINAEENRAKGIPEGEGFFSNVMKATYEGAGHLAGSLPKILSLGKWGLPIFSAIMGGGEEAGKEDGNILKGIATGTVEGVALHNILRGVSFLPRGAGEAGGGLTFGGLTLQSEMQKAEGEVDWSNVASQTLLGIVMTAQGRKIPQKEFINNIRNEYSKGKESFVKWAEKENIPKENAEKFHTELKVQIDKTVGEAKQFKKENPEIVKQLDIDFKPETQQKIPKAEETSTGAKLAQEKAIPAVVKEFKTRQAEYKEFSDGKIFKTSKDGRVEITREEFNKVLEQKGAETPRRKLLARAHILEKEQGISSDKAKEIKMDMFGTETMAEMSSNEISAYINSIGKPIDKTLTKVKMPKDFMDITKLWTNKIEKLDIKDINVLEESVKIAKSEKAPFLKQFQERLDVVKEKRTKLIESVQKKHGQTELRIAELKKKGLTDKDLDSIVLEDGTKFTETVKVKREKNGVLSAVITKDQLKEIENSYTKEKPADKWRERKPIRDRLKIGKEEAKRLYELPQVIFETSGLKKTLYDPVIKAERSSQDLKTDIYNKFEKEGLLKQGNAVLPERFMLSKQERIKIGKYYLDRQGKKTGVKFKSLSTRSKKFVKTFDNIIKDSEKKFFEVAKRNGLEPRKVENYAPLLTSKDIELADDVGLMDFITRKHPAFFSTKERAEKVPIEVYEKDYAKVATTWIDKMADFNNIGEILPQIKYLTDSKEFSDIVTAWDQKYIKTWVHDLATPRIEKPLLKDYARPLRKAASVAALGANIVPVIKQSLTQIPLAFIEGVHPKVKSQFAKDFGVNVKDLPAIKQRKGNVSIQDMQDGYARAVVGSLTEFDKFNARLSLNSLLDKSYKKYKKEGLPLDENLHKLVLKEAQDKLDLWYGGMTKAQMPEAFRSEGGKLLNMFIYPLTSQLNGFYLQIAKARGFGEKSSAIAKVLASATTIAYMEQTMTKMSFKWNDVADMAKDITESLAGNIPVLGSIVFSLANDQPYSPSPIINSITRLFKKANKFVDNPASVDELLFAAAEMFGLPKQIRRTYEGVQFIRDKGIRDKNNRLIARDKFKGDKLRALIRGKYGTKAAQEYFDRRK